MVIFLNDGQLAIMCIVQHYVFTSARAFSWAYTAIGRFNQNQDDQNWTLTLTCAIW